MVKSQIEQFYKKIFNIVDKNIGNFTNCLKNNYNFEYLECNLTQITNKDDFIKKFQIPILKNISKYFNFGDINLELEKIKVEFEKVSLVYTKDENLKSENNTQETFQKVDTFKSEKSYLSPYNNQNNILITNTTNDNTFFSHEFKKRSEKKPLTNITSLTSLSQSFLKSFLNLKKIEKFDIIYYNSQEKTKKLALDAILENILNFYKCTYISFMDKSTSVFYEGGWNREKHFKQGLGSSYMTDKLKGRRYKYYGYFYNDLYNGIGMFTMEDGYSYYGEFRDGLQNGYGIEITNLTSYKGFFINGKYFGYGEYESKQISYFGGFNNGSRDYLGLILSEDNSKYCGNFSHGKMNGLGLFVFPAGHKYYGNWVEDKMNGIGSYFWSKGDKYVGYYENDLRHGQGEYSFKNGAVLKGIWKECKKEGKFEFLEITGNYFIYYKNDIQIE